MNTALRIGDILQALGGMDDAAKQALLAKAITVVGPRRWVPNPGPQTDAYFSKADEIFFGGQAGGGKSDLELGLALTEHRRSLVLRRTNREALGLVERLADIIGNREGWSGQHGIWRIDERTVEVSGCQLEDDKQKFKGAPHDLICWDEVSDFTESQYVFINGWNRSTLPNQRCRVVAAGNPPTSPEGLWVLKRWAAWLDPTHPHPAAPGELRWYTTGEDGKEIEVDGPGPHVISGESIGARSRTFIPSRLSDNPDLEASGYAATLAALPEELRAAYRDGRFDLGLRDKAYQCIPTAWVRAAQARWTPAPPAGVPMCAIGVDASGGGTDPMIIATRHDGWYAPLIVIDAKQIPMDSAGSYCAGMVVMHRRDDAHVIVDLGGGYGSSMYEHLKANRVDLSGYKGAEAGNGRTLCGKFGFLNKRSQAIWKFREALDPGQPGGSSVMLPADPELVADLTAPSYTPDSKTITVESKKNVCDRLGRSTDKGDAVVMAWYRGLKTANIVGGFRGYNARKIPQVVYGHKETRR